MEIRMRRSHSPSLKRPPLAVEALEDRTLPSGFTLNNAVYRPSNATLYIDYNRDGVADQLHGFGVPGDKAVAGDVNGDGLTDIAIFRSGQWYIDFNRDGVTDFLVNFGKAGDVPLIGDVNGD